jgi:hypothetical protein
MTIRTQQDRGRISSSFELELEYVKISFGCHGKALVGTLKGYSRRGTPWEVRRPKGSKTPNRLHVTRIVDSRPNFAERNL